ncbi:biosynthetic-type acetolactate synthase large subunit [Desertibacillus haloalkaliphilus]|nr:biosynthetic-type acetolactate synthase large subunit [Desertibacillus haloalkaliphilus]MBU8906046.1 biosynthetic-type acetolactate synthase large subunit [Desertibacillus haloalkaliphilus]
MNTETVANGADQLLNALKREEASIIFGQVREPTLPIFHALSSSTHDIDCIQPVHEQATIHAADGYARATGKPGVAIISAGPSLTNAITGLATAYMDSVPLVVIAAHVSDKNNCSDQFQELDGNGIVNPVAKHVCMIEEAGDISRLVSGSFSLALSGRPGPIVLLIPKELLSAPRAVETSSEKVSNYQHSIHPLPENMISLAATELNKAKRPVLLIGGGVISSGACELLHSLVERTNIPVVSTLMGLGALRSDHHLHLGMVGMHGTIAANRAVYKADLLISLGVRFSDRITGKISAFSPQSKKVHIDIDQAELNKIITVDLPVIADIKEFLQQFITYLHPNDHQHWIHETASWPKQSPQYNKSDSILKPQGVIRWINEVTNGEAIIATDVGQHQIFTALNYCFTSPRSFLTSGGLGTMGFGVPAAIGAASGYPDKQVVCISGDGSFQMNVQELLTIARYQLPIKIVIINNGYLGMVRQWQELFYQKRYSHVKISSPDYLRLAESYGINSFRAEDEEEAKAIISKAFTTSGPVLMEFNVKKEGNVYPIVPPGASNQAAMLEKAEKASQT